MGNGEGKGPGKGSGGRIRGERETYITEIGEANTCLQS